MVKIPLPTLIHVFGFFAVFSTTARGELESVSGIVVNDAGAIIVNSTVTLPQGGKLEVQSGGSATVTSNGTVDGDVTIDELGEFSFCGTITGELINFGTVTANCGNTVTILGEMTNSGMFCLTQDTSLSVAGALVNTAMLDIVTGGALTVGCLENSGTVLNQEKMSQGISISTSSSDVIISYSALSSHFYQLQYRSGLLEGEWIDIGPRHSDLGLIDFVDTDALLEEDTKLYRIKITDE